MEASRQVEVPRPRCPYCKAPVAIDEDKRACEACMSWAHAECVLTHGSCPACGAAVRGASSSAAAGERRPTSPAERAEPRGPAMLGGAAAPANTLSDWLLLLGGGLAIFFASFVAGLLALTLGDRLLGTGIHPGTQAGMAAAFACLVAPLGAMVLALKIDRRRAGAGANRPGREGSKGGPAE